jgi:hypothetical protein
LGGYEYHRRADPVLSHGSLDRQRDDRLGWIRWWLELFEHRRPANSNVKTDYNGNWKSNTISNTIFQRREI